MGGLADCGRLGKDDRGRWFEEVPEKALTAWVEKQYGCGGVCVSDLALFAFPHVPGGAPVDQSSKLKVREPCYTGFAHELEVQGDLAALLLFAASVPHLVAMCSALWIVCHPPPRQRDEYVLPSGHDAGDVEDGESDRLLSYWGFPAGDSDDDEAG